MLQIALDVVFVLIAGSVAWFVAQQLFVEAVTTFLAIVLSSLVAIVAYEPVTRWVISTMFSEVDWRITMFLWSLFALVIFAYTLVMLQQVFSRTVVEPPLLGGRVESVGCVVVGGLSGYWLAAFLLTVLHTVPGPRDFWGVFEPDAAHRSSPVMAFAPDYQFLSFVNFTCVPHSPWTGSPWLAGGPAFTPPQLKKGSWNSFPVRYSLWREEVTNRIHDYNGDSLDDYEERFQSNYQGDYEGDYQGDHTEGYEGDYQGD